MTCSMFCRQWFQQQQSYWLFRSTDPCHHWERLSTNCIFSVTENTNTVFCFFIINWWIRLSDPLRPILCNEKSNKGFVMWKWSPSCGYRSSFLSQRCCYDPVHKGLISSGPGAGFVESIWNPLTYLNDEEAHLMCCGSGDRELCEEFHQKRPADNCRWYRRPWWGT